MLTKEKASELFAKLQRFSSGGDLELLIGGGKSTLTRFANNTILQNVADEHYDISVRAQFGGRTARASTNKFDDDSLRSVVQAAEQLAKVQDEDPDLPEMYSGRDSELATPSRKFDATIAIGPAERAQQVAAMVRVATRHSLNSSGVYAVNDHVEGLFNSKGVARWYEQSFAEASVTMTAENSTGWQKANSPDASSFDSERLAEVAAKKALDSADPKEIPPGKYTVILEPSAVLDLIGFMFWDFGGQAVLDQRSFLNNRMGTKLFGDNISIADDVTHPLQSGAAWDGEGVARTKLDLIRNGVIRNVAFARGSAKRIAQSEFASQFPGAKPTGHGFPLPNEMGEAPTNIVFEVAGPTKSVEEMVAETERGILVTRVWYIREVDPYEKILTGMTRDGAFLVENGKAMKGIRNFRFNESLIHMLNHVVALGEPVRASGEEAFDMIVPAMKVDEFNFTEVTNF